MGLHGGGPPYFPSPGLIPPFHTPTALGGLLWARPPPPPPPDCALWAGGGGGGEAKQPYTHTVPPFTTSLGTPPFFFYTWGK